MGDWEAERHQRGGDAAAGGGVQDEGDTFVLVLVYTRKATEEGGGERWRLPNSQFRFGAEGCKSRLKRKRTTWLCPRVVILRIC
jgi:hypothetical protein